MKIEGRNAVYEALKSDTTIDRLVVQRALKDSASQNIINLAREKGVKINFVDKDALDRESLTKRHQGFICSVTDFKYADFDEIKSICSSKKKPILILDGIEDPHNLGSIIRVAECAGCAGIVIGRHRQASINETVIKVAQGAASHVKVARVTNINSAIDELKNDFIAVYAAELGGKNIYETKFNYPCAIVIGGEGKGVKRLTKDKCDAVLSIPMRGNLNSLNASVAAGIVVFEILRNFSK